MGGGGGKKLRSETCCRLKFEGVGVEGRGGGGKNIIRALLPPYSLPYHNICNSVKSLLPAIYMYVGQRLK